MVYFSQHFFSDRKKKLKFDETMTSPKLFKKDIMQKPFLKVANGACFSVVASSSEE